MFLSRLIIDVGENPDRPRPGRLWLRNLYHVHQRLCMAFPSDPRKQRDPDFLAPYDPSDFPEQRHQADQKKTEDNAKILRQVHAKRDQDTGFLFRIDPLPGSRAMILVQSPIEPDWDYAFQNASFLRAYDVKYYDPPFKKDDFLRFRLVANPTKRLSRNSREAGGQPLDKWQNKDGKGKRVPVPSATEIEAWRRNNPDQDARMFIDSQLFGWLERQGEKAGFSVKEKTTTIRPGYSYWKKPRDSRGQRLRTVRYDGFLQVTDADRLRDTLIQGLGPGKAYGLGLLSLAPP